MEIMRLLNGIVVTGTAKFTGTATSISVPAGGLGRVKGASIVTVGTTAAPSVPSFRLGHALTGDTIGVPDSGSLTLQRLTEVGGTNADLEIMYTLVGF